MPRSSARHQPRRRGDRPRITLDQLRTFLAVAEEEHVTGAAHTLELSQGSVSTAVSRLEAALGLPLLQRAGRNVRLTDVGRAVRQLGAQVLDRVAQIEELTVGYLAFERGEVTIAAGRVAGAHQLPGWLAPFVATYPEVDVHITLAPLHAVLGMLRDGDADVAIVSAEIRLPGLEKLMLERTELVLVVAAQHPLATSRTHTRDLSQHRYLAHEQGSATRLHSERLVGPDDYRGALELEEGALHAALLAGIGFAVMPRSAVDAQLAAGQLVEIEHPGRPVMQSVWAARRNGLHTPAAQVFWGHLQKLSVETR